MPEPSDSSSHSQMAHALECTCNKGFRDFGEAPSERKWRVVPLSRKNRQPCLCPTASGCGGGIEKYSARPQSQSTIFLLVWQRLTEVGGWQLAAGFPTPLPNSRLAQGRRIPHAVPTA